MASDDEKTQIVPTSGAIPSGTQLNGIYEIEDRIAEGGMGEVYRGRNIQTDDLVAIKVVLPEHARDQKILALFRKEATILPRLSHDAIVRYHVFTFDPGINRHYLAMEFVEGVSLAEHLKSGPMDSETARRFVRRVASGLAAAHEAGVIHRDLSPDNIILPGDNVGKAKIIDFGIAKATAIGGGTLIGSGFAGKYSFVSPEQLGDFGGEITARSDIYSLGLVFAAALRGQPLDMGSTPVEAIDRRRGIPDISGIDPALLPVVEAMLQPNPEHRPPSMDAVVMMLAAPSEATVYAQGVAGGERPAGYISSIHPRGSTPPPSVAPGSVAPGVGGQSYAPASHPPASAPPTAYAPSTPPPLQGSAPPVGESPFGSAALGSAVGQEPLLRQPAPQQAPARRSGGGLIAALILVVVLLAGAGAYFSGLFDRLVGVQEAVAPPPDLTPATGGEEVAQTPEDAPSEEAATEEEAPPAEEQAGLTPEGGEDATEPPLDAAASWVEWLDNYDGGDCFYATATSVSDTALEVEGFSTSAAPFEGLLQDFKRTYDIEPRIGVRVIEPAQCGVVDFLHALRANSGERPGLTLSSDIIGSGDQIQGTLSNVEERVTAILLVDNAGVVYNLRPHLRQGQDQASFNIRLGLDTPAPVPQVIIAIASTRGLETTEVTEPVLAGTLFPRVLEEIRSKDVDAAAAVKYFRLGG